MTNIYIIYYNIFHIKYYLNFFMTRTADFVVQLLDSLACSQDLILGSPYNLLSVAVNMGRKKIQISRIGDERNRQVRTIPLQV